MIAMDLRSCLVDSAMKLVLVRTEQQIYGVNGLNRLGLAKLSNCFRHVFCRDFTVLVHKKSAMVFGCTTVV